MNVFINIVFVFDSSQPPHPHPAKKKTMFDSAMLLTYNIINHTI